MSMTLTITAKELNPSIRYINPIQKTIIKKVEDVKQDANFLDQKIIKGVKSLSHFEKRRILKILKTTYLTLTSTLGLAIPVLAQSSASVMNSEILEIMKYLEAIAAIGGVGLAIILLQAAGVYRMFPKKKTEATEWTVDILKGLLQLVVAPILVMTITLATYFLFGNSEWFIKPF